MKSKLNIQNLWIPTQTQFGSVKSPGIHQFLCFDPLDQEKQVASENKGLENSIMCCEDEGALESEIDSNSSLADITTLEGIDCPSLFESLSVRMLPSTLLSLKRKRHNIHLYYGYVGID